MAVTISCTVKTPGLPNYLNVEHVGEKSTTGLDEIDVGELTEAQIEMIIEDWGEALRKHHKARQQNVQNILMR